MPARKGDLLEAVLGREPPQPPDPFNALELIYGSEDTVGRAVRRGLLEDSNIKTRPDTGRWFGNRKNFFYNRIARRVLVDRDERYDYDNGYRKGDPPTLPSVFRYWR